MASHITQIEISKLFIYRNGQLIRKVTRSSRARKGQVVGTMDNCGYLHVYINKRNYRVHRLIFLLVKGYLPDCIDHIDRNKVNNKIENLRPASIMQNFHNQSIRSSNVSGVRGVSWHKGAKKWRARLKYKYKEIHVGFFKDIKKAEEAVKEARREYYGEFA